MEAISTFEQGLNEDTSKVFMSNKQYLKALNMRPIGVLGRSNGALVNIKGNNCELAFPKLQNVYKIIIDRTLGDSGSVQLTINGQSTQVINITASTTTQDIYSYITTLSNCYNGSYNPNKTFATAYNNTSIYIYQNPEYNGCSSIASSDPLITNSIVSGLAKLSFVGSDGLTSIAPVPFIEANVDTDPIVIIGSTFINDINYLFTCNFENINSNGQIWELTYNEIEKTTNIKLLYYNVLDFTVNFPIPPTATIGRYEVPTVQRIYWSDNNNPVRSVNVKDPQLMALDLDNINLRPSVSMSVPTLYNIIIGSAINEISTTSTYQCAYRLVKNNGAITNYSTISNIVYPTKVILDNYVESQPNYAALDGTQGTTNKALQWVVQGVDTSFDTIEFVIIIRNAPSKDVFLIHKYDTQAIGSQSTIYTTFTNDTAKFVDITEEEFLIDNTTFTHTKTIDQKDNRLFFGNVKNKLGNAIDNYDTRVFRFGTAGGSNTVLLKDFESNTSVTPHTIIGGNYTSIPLNYDAIPVYNLGLSTDDDPLFDGTYKYQQGGTIIGGTGPNISYKFGSILLKTDETPLQPASGSSPGSFEQGTTRDDNLSTHIFKNGYRKAGERTSPYSDFLPTYKNLAPDQDYYTNHLKESMGFEYYSGNYKSYQHNEIYRFGILFYAKTGTKYFVKWIGDIKFPNYSDSPASGFGGKTDLGTEVTDFRSMYTDSSGAYSVVPYIDFTVNIPAELASEILGYEIVRLPRDDSNRSITSQGLINQVARFFSTTQYCLPSTNPTASNLDPLNSSSTGDAVNNCITYHPFSNICDQSTANIISGDKLILTEKYTRTDKAALWPKLSAPSGISDDELFYVSKYFYQQGTLYDGLVKGSNTLKILEGKYTSQGISTNPFGPITLNTIGATYINRSFNTGSIGPPSIILATDTSYLAMIWSTYNGGGYDVAGNNNNPNSKLLGVHFKPTILKSQYGGRTFIARSNSEYISCGAFCKVNGLETTNIKVLGGDIYHGILDIQKAIKDSTNGSFPDGFSQSWYFPTQSIYNVDLRNGFHVNSDLNNSGPGAIGHDDYSYSPSYSYENTLNTYIQQPFSFNETNTLFNRVYWSEIKFNGETNDSWSVIPVNNFHDVDGSYGPINALISLKQNMHFLQDRGIGTLLINQYSTVQDDQDQSIGLGIGTTLEKHIYNMLDVGTKHQWSIASSSTNISFIDINRNKIYHFDGSNITPISDIKGVKGTLNRILHDNIIVNDNPILFNGILTTYDYLNNEFLYTFLNGEIEKYTIVYSDIIDYFSSYYSNTPYIYINNHNKLYTPSDYNSFNAGKLFMSNIGNYGSFYNIVYPSTIKANINPNPIYTKIFDNLSWISDSIRDNTEYIDEDLDTLGNPDSVSYLNDTFTRIRLYNEFQNTDWVTLDQTPITGNLRKSEQGYNIQLPRNKVNFDTNPINTKSIFDPSILTKTTFGDRLRDKYMIADLEYNNIENNRFIVHNLKTNYRISDR